MPMIKLIDLSVVFALTNDLSSAFLRLDIDMNYSIMVLESNGWTRMTRSQLERSLKNPTSNTNLFPTPIRSLRNLLDPSLLSDRSIRTTLVFPPISGDLSLKSRSTIEQRSLLFDVLSLRFHPVMSSSNWTASAQLDKLFSNVKINRRMFVVLVISALLFQLKRTSNSPGIAFVFDWNQVCLSLENDEISSWSDWCDLTQLSLSLSLIAFVIEDRERMNLSSLPALCLLRKEHLFGLSWLQTYSISPLTPTCDLTICSSGSRATYVDEYNRFSAHIRYIAARGILLSVSV